MRPFMDHVQTAFYEATGWSHDSSYSALNATSDGASRSLSNWTLPCSLATDYKLQIRLQTDEDKLTE